MSAIFCTDRSVPLAAIAMLAGALMTMSSRSITAGEPNAALAARVAELGSGDFAVRQQATAELEQAGAEAVPLIARAAIAGDAEVRTRAQAILLGQAVSQRPELREAARSSLREWSQLADSDGGNRAQVAARRLREALASLVSAELTRLGAMVMPVQNGPPLTYNVQLGQAWAGGDERLALLADLGDVIWLSVENARLSDAALAHIAKLTSLTRLFLGSSRITGTSLAQLAPLKKLQYLSLKQLPINDARLAALPDFPELQYLGLDGTRVGNDGLRKVARYPQLQVLWLDNTAVTDAGLANLEPLANLRTLYLPGTNTAGPGLADLQHLPNLTSISLQGVTLSPQSLRYVAQLEQLESLGLDRTNVTDDQLADLSGLGRLRVLWLSGTQVGDPGLEHLRSLRKLEMVHLSDTQISSEGAAELQRALPNCQVTTAGRLGAAGAPPANRAPPRISP
jgi:hypothetical protein